MVDFLFMRAIDTVCSLLLAAAVWPGAPERPRVPLRKFGLVYTDDDADVDRSRCTQCGKLNEPIEF